MAVRKNRIGLTFLSKKNYKDAWDEELMVNKDTGEILIKSPDGNIVPYMYLARLDQHIDAFSDKITDMGLLGNMYMVDNETTKILPDRFNFNETIIDGPIKICGTDVKRMMVSLSYDTFAPDNNLRLQPLQVPVTYNLEFRLGDEVKLNMKRTMSSDEMLTDISNIDVSDTTDFDSVYLSDIKLTPNASDPIVFDNVINIVYGLLIFLIR